VSAADVGAVLTQGWLLALIGAAWSYVMFLAGRGAGRRRAHREIDESRAGVLRACEDAAVGRASVPGQRGGER
jgi:hypothetical protein